MNVVLALAIMVAAIVAAIYTLFWLPASLVSTPNGKINQKWRGFIYKPVELTSEGKTYYSLRIYRWWGLIPTQLYVVGGSYEQWKVVHFKTERQLRLHTQTSLDELESLIQKLSKDTWSFTSKSKSVEEMKMDKLLEDE